MKKTFTLVLMGLFLLTGGVNAQNYRKWDFTNWSATTIANLAAGEDWSDDEKGDGTNMDLTANNCYWQVGSSNAAGETLTANGATIAELEGLLFTNSKARALAIAVNYPETSIGTYHGGQYLWLGSSAVNYFVIPKVAPGTTIKMGVESHKNTDARGVNLYIGWSETGTQLYAPDGGTVSAPTTYEDQTWLVPENADGANDDGTYDITVRNTNGCHIYYIEVGDADQKSKIAYLYQGTPDGTQAVAESVTNYEVEAIDIAAEKKTAEELRDYDAVVIAANVNDAAYAAELKNALGWTPIVNTSYGLYELWGLGTAVQASEPLVILKSAGHSLFNGLDIIDDPDTGIKAIEVYGDVYGIQDLGTYFANDDVVGTDLSEALATVHIHNANHNAYIYIPAGNDQLTVNAIKAATNSKAKITAAPKPAISLEYKNMNTNVTITSGVTGAQIFYTTDGSEPTENSTLYTETFNVTTECIVKAVAKGDGYTLSEVAESAVVLKSQAAAPTISVEKGNGETTVTISGEGTIWYNYSNATDTTKSTKYTNPFVIKIPRTIYAFVTQEGKVNSELATATAEINGYQARTNILAHMDANSAEYNGGSTSTAYYFSWGKDKATYPYYDLDSRTEESTVDPETGDDVAIVTYAELSPEEEKDFGNGWMVRSRGQLVIWENQTTGTNYGNSDGYNYASVDDENPNFPATKAYINLADKNTTPGDATFPYNAYIVTTNKFKGPFDVVINAGSITKPDSPGTHTLVLQVSTDGYKWENNWETIGDTIVISNSARLTHNVTRSYEGTDEVYVRAYLAGNNSKVGFYDIYIANTDGTGVTETKVQAQQAAGIYNLNGVRQNGLRRGLNIVVEADGSVKKVIVK